MLWASLLFVGLGVGPSWAADPVGQPYQRLIERVSARHQIDPALLTAMVEVESARNAEAVSHAGAVGLIQLMPGTARRFGVVDRTDPEDNLDGGARYFRWLLQRFRGDVQLALAGYNAGEAAVDRYGGIPPYRETQDYVRKVLRKAGYGQVPRVAAAPQIRMTEKANGTIEITNIP